MLSASRQILKVSPKSLTRSLSSSIPRTSASLLAKTLISSRTTFRSSTLTSQAIRMSSHGSGESTIRPDSDKVIQDIADYVHNYKIDSELAYATARLCLIDTIGCGLEGLRVSPACTALMAPVVPGTIVPNGSKVPGTDFQMDPVRAAFAIGTQIRYLDFNDCFLAAEWGHPSDSLGAIMAVSDYISRTNVAEGKAPLTVKDILTSMIMAHEIQGCMALENSFNRVGLDHVVLVKLASASVVSKLLGLTREQTIDVISQVFVDGQSLRTYRHAPNTGSRKSWAAGDACSRAVNLALLVQRGEMGIPTVLTAKTWGFYDVLFGGKPFEFQRPYGSYIMENVLFKISFPAEFHAQSAAEAGLILHGKLAAAGKTSDDIESVKIRTQEAAIRIIDKSGKLDNFADRDHCIQYMVAVPLIFGRLTSEDYSDDVAADPRIDALREKIACVEDKTFSAEYHDPEKRFIGNAITITLKDGTVMDEVHINYPVGHKRRREEGTPLLNAKFVNHITPHFTPEHVKKIVDICADQASLEKLDVPTFVDLFVKQK